MSPASTIQDTRICELGEGPLWHPEREQLFWFDILGRRMLSQKDGEALEWHFDEMVSAAGWVDRDTLLVASERALFRFDIASGARTDVAALEADNSATRSNDGRADPMGGFWIGTMGKHAEPGAGAIYRFHGGELHRLVPDVSIPNAICFAPDGRTAYYADTTEGCIRRLALDEAGWPEAGSEVFADLSGEGVSPDGAVIDAEGGLWNAQFGAGRVARYHQDGSFDRAIAVAGIQTTCPAFGGPGLATLFVTTACEGLGVPGAADGRLYAAEPGTRGLPEPAVRL